MPKEILKVEGLSKSFNAEESIINRIKRHLKGLPRQKTEALKNVSFCVNEGETLGILGESGSGKSTLARVLMGVYPPDSGRALVMGKNVFSQNSKERLEILKDMQMVFQDPFGSLNPRMNIRQIIAEPLKIHKLMPKKNADELLVKLLEEVGLNAEALDRYPSEFSGGQRQRIGICRALVLSPKLIIADEAVSALDVSVQAQILELLIRQKKQRNLAMIFISHDVAVVRQISDRIALLFKGHLVEELLADELLTSAVHPYTKRLLASALFLRESTKQEPLKETPPKTDKRPPPTGGCPYKEFCELKIDKCNEAPKLKQLSSSHLAACHLV